MDKINDVVRRLGEGNLAARILLPGHDVAAFLADSVNAFAEKVQKEQEADRRRVAAQKRLLTNIAHDLRTPITSIVGYVDALRDGLGDEKDRERYLRIISQKTGELAALVDDLFYLTRLDSGDLVLVPEHVDLAELLRQVVLGFAPRLESEGVEATIQIPGERCEIMANEIALRRVFANLISNSIRHGVGKTAFGLELSREGGQYRALVWDNGRGFHPDVLPDITCYSLDFNAGTRLHPAHGLRAGGDGGRLYARNERQVRARLSLDDPKPIRTLAAPERHCHGRCNILGHPGRNLLRRRAALAPSSALRRRGQVRDAARQALNAVRGRKRYRNSCRNRLTETARPCHDGLMDTDRAGKTRTLEQLLCQGKWERPSDKMAVYTELKKGEQWGIRVTFLGDSTVVEAIDGPHCCWYDASAEVHASVGPPTWWERLRGVTFLDKLAREVETKRAVAAARNSNSDREDRERFKAL